MKRYEKREKLGIKIGAKSGNLSPEFQYICKADGCFKDIRSLGAGIYPSGCFRT